MPQPKGSPAVSDQLTRQHLSHTLTIARLLEDASIPCCLVGVSALRHYGSAQARQAWEICIEKANSEAAASLLGAASQSYVPCPSERLPLLPLSLTYHHFRLEADDYRFVLVPADDCHLELDSLTVEHTDDGIPYPNLAWFVQSLLDMGNADALSDLTSTMSLTLEWGDQHLDLSETVDLAWARTMNDKIRALPSSEVCEIDEQPRRRAEIWQAVMTGSANRT